MSVNAKLSSTSGKQVNLQNLQGLTSVAGCGNLRETGGAMLLLVTGDGRVTSCLTSAELGHAALGKASASAYTAETAEEGAHACV